MKLGICTSIDNVKTAKQSGCSYIEQSLSSIMEKSEKELKRFLKKCKKADFNYYAFNGFFPRRIKFGIKNPDYVEIEEYSQRAVKFAAEQGAKVIVIGSGGSRNADTKQISVERGVENYAKVLQIAGKYGEKYNIDIAVEPLRKQETNVINTVKDGLTLVKAINMPRVKLLADFYHMSVENESMDSIRQAKDYLVHTHIANGETRNYPKDNDIGYRSFFEALKDIGYTGGISIEGSCEDIKKELPESIRVLNSFI